MIFVKPYSVVILISLLILISSASLIFGVCSIKRIEEGFELVPLATDPSTKSIMKGYYQVDDDRMAILPYGFGVDPIDSRKIIPVTKVGMRLLVPSDEPRIPVEGEKMPDQFYFVSDSTLAVLPPNMLPKIRKINFDNSDPPKTLYYYDIGYISETQYYKNKYEPAKVPSVLPSDMYFVDKDKKTVAFLEYGMVADKTKGYGAIPNPNIDSRQNLSYRDVIGNYDVEFHDDVEAIRKRTSNLESSDKTLVLNPSGDLVELNLPKTDAQSSVTFYQPGEFPFGASKYVPNYEDSVYLSSIGYRTKFGNSASQTSGCDSVCNAYNAFKNKMDSQCDSVKT